MLPERSQLRALALLCMLVGGTLASAQTASARPLKLSELYDLGHYLGCTETCPAVYASSTYDRFVEREQCLVACGHAPRIWEKNGIAPVDRADHELALLEYNQAQDSTTAIICYGDADQTVVIPAALCTGGVCEAVDECTQAECAADNTIELQCIDDQPGGPRCIWPLQKRPGHCPDVVCAAAPTHSFQECADGDGDGVPAWLEKHLGLDDGVVESRCGSHAACRFDEECGYRPDLGHGLCQPRDCGGGACTAFHLQLVAEDDTEVLVQIHYDYTPLPARALDLYLTYDHTSLTLADARPLALLNLQGKELASTHLSDGTLRLSVLDTDGTHPIPTGPIIELVFRRIGPGGTDIAFSTNDLLQTASVAPLQGDAAGQGLLTDDALWGPSVALGSRDDAPTKLRMWFGFDALSAPATYLNVPDADALCAKYPLCANEPSEVEKAKLLARLAVLQNGSVAAREVIEGVTNNAVYLDGSSDHLRLPVTFEEPLAPASQSFSFGTWFYTEGNSLDELKQTPQVLFSHNGPNERTRFGLRLESDGNGAIALKLFDGDFLSKAPVPATVTIATGIQLRTWHHVGFALDASLGKMDLYFDGVRVRDYTFPRAPSVVCPQFFGGTDVLQHVEGDVTGGTPPEHVYYAANRSNLYRIERMNAGGLGATTVLGDGQFSYRDPDYHPGLDRIVYSANVSGNFEIWMANGDGTDQRQLTSGFGDTARGIIARNPSWAPDGSGIVFESNVYDVLAQDNTFKRVAHIYYIGFDGPNNVVAIEQPDGSTVEQLDYVALIGNQTVNTYRLTSAQDRNHRNARWLTGSADDGSRGELLIDTSSPMWDGHQIYTLKIPQIIDFATVDPVIGLGEAWHEIEMLAAHHSEKAGLVPLTKELLFYQRTFATYESTSEYTLTETPTADGVNVSVAYNPAPVAADCWDRNHNRLQDTDEDRNADQLWDTRDCLPHEIRNLYLEFDASLYNPILEDANGQAITAGTVVTAMHKTLRLKGVEPLGHSYVRIEVMSPLDASPLTPGQIAVIRFVAPQPGARTVAFGTFTRESDTEFLLKDLTSVAPPTTFEPAGLFEQIEDGVFSPDGDQLLLAAVSKSRPVLLRTETLLGASGAESLFVESTKLSGLDWVRDASFYPCNWAGGTLHLQNKQILAGFRGGLDDLKLYAGLRDPDAFRSEAERGHEFLAKDGRDGQLDSRLPSCGNSHAECPPFHLCVQSQCVSVPCDPEDPFSCSAYEARCTLRPMSVEQEHVGANGNTSAFDWVCGADCNVDAQCFTERCLNGPCRFCEQTEHACMECRDVVKQLGALSIATIEGCPDTKSFACVAGACITECYAFEDGQSKYLCDSLLEYCDHGKCVMHDWTWWDLAPATFQGTGDMVYDVAPDPINGWPGYSQVVDQRVPVEVHAYGVTDYGSAPEIVVEARGGPFYGANWNRIARIMVHNRTLVEANQNPYVVTSPHPFNDLRLRLITAPYNNISGAATGLGAKDDQFCLADFKATAVAAGTPNAAPDPCYFRAQGSKYTLGYPADISPREQIGYCKDQKHANCPPASRSEHDFLWGGSPAVVVLDVQVDGGGAMNNITTNKVCSYEGGITPVDDGAPKKMFYGDISKELSPERDAYCAANPGVCDAGSALMEFDRATYGYGLLNCNVVDPTVPDAASITMQNIIILRDFPLEQGSVMETANNCVVDIDAFRTEPCYGWIGSGSSVDPSNSANQVGASTAFASFEFGLFSNFAHGDGYDGVDLLRFPVKVRVTGYAGGDLRVGWRDSMGALVETATVPAPAAAPGIVDVTFPTDMAVGRRYSVIIDAQPSTPNHVCTVDATLGAGAMPGGGVVVPVACVTARSVKVAVQGLDGNIILKNSYSAGAGQPTTGLEELVATADGTWTFGHALTPGATYDVTIKRPPAGQICTIASGAGMMGTGDVAAFVVCRDIAQSPLAVSVNGLAGSGFELIEQESGRTLRPNGNGTAAFPGLFEEGKAYQVGVTVQPSAPPQLCTVTSANGGRGTMPGVATTGAIVTCTTLPTYSVGGGTVGLQGTGLVLSLNGGIELLTIPHPVGAAGATSFAFATEFVAGTAYSAIITQQPENPPQDCALVFGTGTIAKSNITNLTVACRPRSPLAAVYSLGGTVAGLRGSGLKLSLNGGVQELVLDASGAFSVPTKLAPDTDYTVVIARQPSNPTQVCTIDHAEGTTANADVTDIGISCRDAMKVTVEVQSPGANGAHVKALLVSSDANPTLVGVSSDKMKITDGKVTFVLRAPDQAGQAGQTGTTGSAGDASVPPGQYRLFVFVNDDLDFDAASGLPRYEATDDRGAFVVVSGTSASPPRVVVTDADLSPLGGAAITVANSALDPHASMRCWFAAAGAGTLTLPVSTTSPVLGTSLRACDPAGAACTTLSGGLPSLVANVLAPLPVGVSYDATCWVDVDNDSNLTRGDLIGTLTGVSIANPLFLNLAVKSF